MILLLQKKLSEGRGAYFSQLWCGLTGFGIEWVTIPYNPNKPTIQSAVCGITAD